MKYELSIVVGTYNRLDQLKRCVDSIIAQTRTRFVLYITDAGSTDGTIEYLQSVACENIVPIFVGRKLGQARAYNDVFNMVDTSYVCWLSDDNEVVSNGLDLAVEILRKDTSIGMVGLKTMDVQGPFVGTPFIGGVSQAGILNVNQGVLPTGVLKKLGGFAEEFRDYGIDNALTADVLFAGYKVVYTTAVALHHFRNWNEDPASENYQWLRERHANAKQLYEKRYGAGISRPTAFYWFKNKASRMAKKLASRLLSKERIRSSPAVRICFIILTARYISLLDPIRTWGKDYHLVQKTSNAKK